MPFVKKSFHIEKPIKAFLFIMKKFNYTQGEAQRLISKGRLIIDGKPIYDKGVIIENMVEIIYFEPESRGLKPIFVDRNFLIYDKPSGVLVHPNSMKTKYSILDEIRSHSGQNANATHRIDMETSGVLLASRDKSSERFLKSSFENKLIKKRYLAWVRGEIREPFSIEAPIKIRDDYGRSKHKVEISQNGKYAKTNFRPLKYNRELNSSLVECTPLTGRTHQIRIHLFYAKHPIVGDPIYGTTFEFATKYLEGNFKLEERVLATGAKRLMLHAYSLDFSYKNRYKIVSKLSFKL